MYCCASGFYLQLTLYPVFVTISGFFFHLFFYLQVCLFFSISIYIYSRFSLVCLVGWLAVWLVGFMLSLFLPIQHKLCRHGKHLFQLYMIHLKLQSTGSSLHSSLLALPVWHSRRILSIPKGSFPENKKASIINFILNS